MENALNHTINARTDAKSALFLTLLGCGLITLLSLVKIPFYPVPFTLQMLAVFILALTQSPKQACSSALCYLFCATIGLPVLCGHANALWILGARGGYLVAFPIAAYLTSYIAHRWNAIYGIIVGLMVVYGLGFVWLSAFFEAKVAFMQGVVFFIPADLLKGLIAIGIAKKWKERI